MQASQNHGGPPRFYSQPIQELESYCWSPFRSHDRSSCSEDSSQGNRDAIPISDQFCTLESSSSSSGTFNALGYNSSSTLSFSPNGSPVSQPGSQAFPSGHHPLPVGNDDGSPLSESCVTGDVDDLRHKLRQLESAMLGSETDTFDADYSTLLGETNRVSSEIEKWKQMVEIISRGDLREVLITCASAVADNDLLTAEWLMSEVRQKVSVSGDPVQRLGAYMLEGLVARLGHSGGSIYRTLRCKQPTSPQLYSYMHLLYEACPYFKFGYLSANGAIAEAMKDENWIHIIDFQIAQGTQWLTLIPALSARPGGPPRIRITGIDDSFSEYARGGGLDIVGKQLSMVASSFNVPFEFHAASLSGSEVKIQNLHVRPGEALAVNFAWMLHHMADESVGTHNHRDQLLRLVRRLSPKVVTLVEQESNTNTNPFLPRFVETVNYYSAVFESIDATVLRDDKDRINVEQHCLARDIVNIIACEGAERVERHELLGKWNSRFVMAGFRPYPLSPLVNAAIRTLLGGYSEMYGVEERDGALFLGWRDRRLIASCAFKPLL